MTRLLVTLLLAICWATPLLAQADQAARNQARKAAEYRDAPDVEATPPREEARPAPNTPQDKAERERQATREREALENRWRELLKGE
jgi:Ni/Co efflux regulator RcnB